MRGRRTTDEFLEERKWWMSRGFKDPWDSYRRHANHAARRGVKFSLTFAEWWNLWAPHYHNRGIKSLQMCMCRTRDEGGYEVGNVRIATNKENHHEYVVGYRAAKSYRLGKASHTKRGCIINTMEWLNKNPFEPEDDDETGDLDMVSEPVQNYATQSASRI